MELLLVIAPMLIIFMVGWIIISIQDWISSVRFDIRRTQRELDRIRRSTLQRQMKEDSMKAAYEVECGITALSTGEVEVLGPGIITFGEEINEAERLLKEASDRKVN